MRYENIGQGCFMAHCANQTGLVLVFIYFQEKKIKRIECDYKLLSYAMFFMESNI